MVDNISLLKTQLLAEIEALGQQALFPSKESIIDEIVRQLESINPISSPLHPHYVPQLLGDWQLVYASNGTVVTRQFSFSHNNWAGITIK